MTIAGTMSSIRSLRRSSGGRRATWTMWTWRAAGRVRKGMSLIDYLFNEKREMLVRMIEFDEEWSGPWIAAPPRPAT